MKFRACLSDPACIRHLLGVVQAVARLTKLCSLRLTSTHVHFVAMDGGGSSGATVANGGVWCELPQTRVFSEYRLVGVAPPEHDQIVVEVRPDALARSLATCVKHATASTSSSSIAAAAGAAVCCVKIKLTRRHSACLSLWIEYAASATAARRTVTHDVPVTVVARRAWPSVITTADAQPRLPRFHVSVELPAVRVLRSVVERLKKLADRVSVAASAGAEGGRLVLRARSHLATAATHFERLRTFPRLDSEQSSDEDDHTAPAGTKNAAGEDVVVDSTIMYRVVVDAKALAAFLSAEQSQPCRAVCNIVDTRLLHLFLLLDDTVLQYFIPGVAVSDGD